MNIARLLLLFVLFQTSVSAEFLTVSARSETVLRGESGTLVVTIQVRPPYHINANPPTLEYLIPAEVTFKNHQSVRFGRPRYPRGKMLAVGGAANPVSVYEGRVRIQVPFTVLEDAESGTYALSGKLSYQPCDDKSCFAPTEEAFTARISIEGPAPGIPPPDTVVEEAPDLPLPPNVPQPSDERGFLSMLIAAFIGGLLLNLTPCVYPLIPITVGYFSRQVPGRTRRFLLAAIYVGAMAIVYAILGTAAAITGSFFGVFLQNPIILIALAALMTLLALGMWGTYDIRLPQRLHMLADSKPGPLGAASMGATMGIVCAPCIGPFVVALLTYVGQRGNPAEGFALFLMLGLGLGLPYLILAAVSESVASLPKAGLFMIAAKRFLGIVLLGLALWFLRPLIGEHMYRVGHGVLFAATGLLLFFWGYGRRSADRVLETRRVKILRRLIGIILITISILFFKPAEEKNEVAWHPYSEAALAESKGNLAMVYITATWCLPCTELKEFTFSNEAVIAATQGITALKADATDRMPEGLSEKYSIVGVPTILFFGRDGNERADLRLVGFEAPTDFVKRVEALTEDVDSR